VQISGTGSVDRNGNGAVDAGELETLGQAGVASIGLAATTQTGDTQAGNTITATGSFTRTDGTTGAIADVSFDVDTCRISAPPGRRGAGVGDARASRGDVEHLLGARRSGLGASAVRKRGGAMLNQCPLRRAHGVQR
jgi:hypothetical protein